MTLRCSSSLAMLIATMVLGLYVATPALAGEYTVAQCHGSNPSHEASTLGSFRGDYAMRNECTSQPDQALKVIPNSGAQIGRRGYWYWEAPPGTKIVAVRAEAWLRRADGHKARLYMADGNGNSTAGVATGLNEPAGFEPVRWEAPPGTGGSHRFYAALVCEDDTANCPAPSEAKTYIRDVELTLRDTSRPTVELSGDDVAQGWKRGGITVELDPRDVGSGVSSLSLFVNDVPMGNPRRFPCDHIQGSVLVPKLAPCPEEPFVPTTVAESGAHPFHDGSNRVTACAEDLAVASASNFACETRDILVDNTGPKVAFSNTQRAEDPELVSADVKDLTSGIDPQSGRLEYRRVGTNSWLPLPAQIVRGNSLQARVDSASHPPGTYEFRAQLNDVAGNRTATLQREDGSKMELQFPLKEPATLDAFMPGGQTRQLAGYRESSKVRGYLRRPDGTPIAGEQVTIREKFDEGSLVQRRTEQVRTGVEGEFVSTIPAGPSREITVSYGGSRRYRARVAPKLDFNVRSRVKLRVERRVKAGRAAHFRGKVGRYFARVPDGGKLVELQFKKRAKTWNTAKEALGTTSRGDIRIPYRFRRYYTERVTFVFRLKVTREGDWPYRVPASSKPVQVTVVPSRR